MNVLSNYFTDKICKSINVLQNHNIAIWSTIDLHVDMRERRWHSIDQSC